MERLTEYHGDVAVIKDKSRMKEAMTKLAEYESTVWFAAKLFTKLDNPVVRCCNCLCNYCVNNVEELWRAVEPSEQVFPCFTCDECREFTGNCRHFLQIKEECTEFVISNCAAKKQRRKMKILKNCY